MRRSAIVAWTLAKVVTAVVCIGWCALHVRKLDPYFRLVVPPWTRVPGCILLILGGVLVLTCGGILSTRWNAAPFPTKGRFFRRFFPREFVAFGPFRYVRNPMSLGAVTLMMGLGLYEESISVLLLALLLFLFLHLVVIYVEEPGLERRFGESYRQYRQSVNRWLPGFVRDRPR